MSDSDNPRRVVAEIRAGADQSAIPQIGSRSIHQYWQLLSVDFQGILLAPQRRPDDGGVAWTWREPAGCKPVTPAELSVVREQLTEASLSFEKNLESSDLGPENLGGLSTKEGVKQLRSKVNGMVAKLTGKPDAKLASFVCRTDGGVRIHSWGATVAAQPFFPDAHDCEVSGTVLVGEKGVADFEVVIESRTGVRLAQTKSDAAGGFRLQKIGPGTHRVRVISERVDFPVSGVMVTVERTSITSLELRSTSVNVASGMTSQGNSPGSSARVATPIIVDEPKPPARVKHAIPWRRWLLGTAIAATMLAVAGGGWRAWNWWRAEERPDVASGESSFSGGRLTGVDGTGRSVPGARARLADTGRRSSGVSAAGLKPSPMSGRNTDGSPTPSLATSDLKEKPPAKPTDAKQSAPDAGHTTNQARPEKNRPEAATRPDSTTKAAPPENDAPQDALQATDTLDVADKEMPQAGATEPKLSPARKPLKPAQTAQAKPSGASPEVDTADSSAPESAADDSAGADRVQDPVVAARSKAGGAKSGRVSPETGQSPVGSSAAGSDETEDLAGANAPDGALTGASNTKAGPAVSAAGTGKKAPSLAVPSTAQGGTPMAAEESPDQTSASDPRGAGLGASAAPETGRRDPGANLASAAVVPPAGSSLQTAALESDEAAPAQPASSGRQSGQVGATATPPQAGRPPLVARMAGSDTSTSGAAEAVDTSQNRSQTHVRATASVSKAPGSPAPRPADKTSAADVQSGGEQASPLASAGLGGASQSTSENTAQNHRFGRSVHVRVSPWRVQLVQDAILATEPVREGEDDAIEGLRKQYVEEREKRIPASFKNPVLSNGCVIEVPADGLSAGGLIWRDATGAGAGGVTVSAARAEIAWFGGNPPANGRYLLCLGNGREVAKIAIEDGGLVIEVAEHVRCWYWIAVEAVAGDVAGAAGGRAARFDWQLEHGGELPDGSRRNDRLRDGRTQRLDLPVDFRESTGLRDYAIVLTDRDTGWAIGSQIEEAPASGAARK